VHVLPETGRVTASSRGVKRTVPKVGSMTPTSNTVSAQEVALLPVAVAASVKTPGSAPAG